MDKNKQKALLQNITNITIPTVIHAAVAYAKRPHSALATAIIRLRR